MTWKRWKDKHAADRLERLKSSIDEALRTGKPLRWGFPQRRAWCPILAKAGIDLLDKTQLRRRKLAIVPDAKPVVIAQYGFAQAHLFIVGRQTEQPAPAPLFEART